MIWSLVLHSDLHCNSVLKTQHSLSRIYIQGLWTHKIHISFPLLKQRSKTGKSLLKMGQLNHMHLGTEQTKKLRRKFWSCIYQAVSPWPQPNISELTCLANGGQWPLNLSIGLALKSFKQINWPPVCSLKALLRLSAKCYPQSPSHYCWSENGFLKNCLWSIYYNNTPGKEGRECLNKQKLQPVSTKEVPKQRLPVLRTNVIFLPGKHSFSNPPSPQLLEDLLTIY